MSFNKLNIKQTLRFSRISTPRFLRQACGPYLKKGVV
jgi:hypothetical protein